MTVINTNVGALNARVAALSAQTNMEKAMQRLSSGMRINSAADDAAGLAVATKMESQLRGINMAIRNSNDGISLVQTAESGMSEISNMVIRMRELSVQMHNGIYSDGDRANAQLEVEALLAEIDKIANNTAFNGVKVLDGSYNSDIRAGNTNPEVINIAIDRMNTDTLGGVGITTATDAALDTSTTFVHTAGKTAMNVAEGQVQISKDVFNQGFKDFVIANAAGTYALSSGGDADLFQVNQATGAISLKDNIGELDFDTARDVNFDGVYEFSVTYTVGSESVTENIVLTVTDTATKTAAANTGTTNLTVSEAEDVSFQAAGVNGVLSDAFKEFVAADTGTTGAFTLANSEDGDHDGNQATRAFTIDGTTGKISAKTGFLDFENPTDLFGTDFDNSYQITVVYTDSNLKTYTETVNISVTDNALEDTGTAALVSERATTGRSSILLNGSDAGDELDLGAALTIDMFSQGAKDFIALHGGSANVFAFATAANSTNDPMTDTTPTNPPAANGDYGIKNTAAAATAATALGTANNHVVEVNDDSGNGTFTVTLALGNLANHTNATQTFTETITIQVTDNNALGSGAYTPDSVGRTEQSGATTDLSGTSNGEAITLNLGDRTLFADLVAYTDVHTGGTFQLLKPDGNFTNAYTKAADGHDNTDPAGNSVDRGFSLNGSELTLDAGADANTYNAAILYTDRQGNTFQQTISLATTASSNPSTATVVQVSTDQTKDAVATSTEVVGGKSVLQVNEAMEATIQVHGANGVLSGELSTFQTAYPKGTWSLGGADAASFELDKLGNITSKDIMNFESTKNQYNFTLTYTMGDESYTETIVLNVVNNTADDNTHLADVNLSTQQGALDAIAILDSSLNTITASQAKLGSTQNRLQHNIDNLTALSSQTEISKGRITDADYAQETSQLSKQQILSQAATSMLAQANQSKQGVLALLQ